MSQRPRPHQTDGNTHVQEALARAAPGTISTVLAPYQDSTLLNLSALPAAFLGGSGGTLRSQWYIPDPQTQWTDPAKNAYESAVEILRKELTADEYQELKSRNNNSMQDVQSAVFKALEEYQTKSKESKVRAWLASCSSRVMFYGAVFDTFSQHHPEYVSLAWGALKFLFIAVLNHEELLVEISKAISRIADVLPRTELHSVLYPTPRMQDAVSQLYAKILEFVLMAIKWYKRSRLSHSITSIIRPFSLSFKPIIEDITERSRRVDELASAASKAELRDLHLSIHGLRIQLTEMAALQQQQLNLYTQSLFSLKEEHKQTFRTAKVEEIKTTLLLEVSTITDDSLAWCRSMRNRRRQKSPTQLPWSELAKLKDWVSEPSSSLLLAQGKGVRTSSLDFAADFLDAVLEQGPPVLWALPSTVNDISGGSTSKMSVSAVLRSLISQALTLNPALVSEGINPLTSKHLKAAATVEQWLELLRRCILSFPRLFLVIDTSVIEAATEAEEARDQYFKVSDFVDYISQIVSQNCTGYIKVVFVSWRFHMTTSVDSEDVFGDLQISTDRGRKVERLMRQPKYRSAFRRKHQDFHERFRSSISVQETS